MTVQDRLVEMLASFARVDVNAIHPQDMLRQEDGGLLDDDEILAFLDEVEGEFGVDISQINPEAMATVEELLDSLSDLVEERVVEQSLE